LQSRLEKQAFQEKIDLFTQATSNQYLHSKQECVAIPPRKAGISSSNRISQEITTTLQI